MPVLTRRDTSPLFFLTNGILFFSITVGALFLSIFIVLKFQQQSNFQQQGFLTASVRDDLNRYETNYSETCKALSRQSDVLQIFSNSSVLPAHSITFLLNYSRDILGADLIYILDRTGTVIASTPAEQGNDFNGNSFRFRPYFSEAMKGSDYRYAALEGITDRRGLYFSSPIRDKEDQIIGVAVIKGGLENIDAILLKAAIHGPVAVLSPDGVIFAASEQTWLFHTSSPLETNRKEELIQSGQFAREPLAPLPVNLDGKRVNFKEAIYTSYSLPTGLHGWSVVTLIPDKKPSYFIIILTCLAFTIPAFFFLLKMKRFHNKLRQKENIHKQNAHLIQLNKEMKKEIEERIETEKKFTEMSEQELQYRLLFEQSKDAIIIVTEDGSFIEANQTFLSMMDCTRTEVMTMKARDFWVDQDDRIIWLNLMKTQGSVIDYQSKQKTRYGTVLDLNLTTNATKTEGGKTVYLTILHDITDKLEDEKELIEAKTQAEQANLAKSNFLANMSHEIRTPMNGIIGMTNIVLASELHREQRNYLEMVSSSADRLLDIINNILDFSKIEAGHLDLEEIDFTIEDKLNELISLMTIKARNNNVVLTTNMAPEIPIHLIGDPTKLMQVLINLTNNGIKFTRNGTVTIDVRLHRELSPSRALLWFGVRDTGIGVPVDKQSAIFESFSQADTSTTRQYGGTGLGLTISSQLCRLMDGEIGLESYEEQGSLFWFTAAFNLPEKAGKPQALKHGKIMDSELAREDIFQNTKVLLAEDDLINRTLARAILEKAKLTVTTVNNGQKAVEQSVDNSYDLILMDIQMPIMDGYEATAAIRQREKQTSAHIPIIAMTAHAIKGDREKCLHAGMDDYVTKPIDPTKLYTAIEKQLLYRALITDPCPRSRELVGHLFADTGWQVTFVENINQCIWECNNSNFDLILIDILMPDMDIDKVTQIIGDHQTETGKHTHIVALSSAINDGMRHKYLLAGINHFIEKPMTKESFTTLINDLKVRKYSPRKN